MKSFITELEKMAQDAVSDIEKISEKIAQEIQVLIGRAFADIKARISSLLRAFAIKVRSLEQKRMTTNAGPSASSFAQRLQSATRNAESEAERLLQTAKTESVAMVHEARDIIRRMADGLNTVRGNVVTDIRKAGLDTYHALVNVGETAIKKVETFFESAFKDVEIDGSFVANHALQVTESATIAINPFIFIALAASAAIIVVAEDHASSIRGG